MERHPPDPRGVPYVRGENYQRTPKTLTKMTTETPEPQRQIEVVRCHCKSIIAGQVLPVGDEASIAEWEADKKRYARRGYSIAIVPEATMGSCKCKELIASLEAQVKAMREAQQPPAGQVIEAGNAMREQLAGYPCMNGGYVFSDYVKNAGDPCPFCERRARNCFAWDTALASAPRCNEDAGGWIPLTEQDQPERNTTAIYWHHGIDGRIETGFPMVADEWRWEHHAKSATHFMKFTPPTK